MIQIEHPLHTRYGPGWASQMSEVSIVKGRLKNGGPPGEGVPHAGLEIKHIEPQVALPKKGR